MMRTDDTSLKTRSPRRCLDPWRRLELEWKIIVVAAVLFIAFAWPVQDLFISRVQTILAQSVDSGLEQTLRAALPHLPDERRGVVLASLERHRQWQVLMPLIIQEQRVVIVGFSLALFGALLAFAIWTLRRLTRPLKNLARAVERIGKGEQVAVAHVSGGALGTVELAVAALQQELGVLREQARVQGMEAAWKDIARVMAHEIKNPLTPIRLTLDRMEEKAAQGESLDAERMKNFLARINTQLDVLERLVNQFRSFSREPEAHLKPLEVGQAIRSVAETLSPRLTSTVQGEATIMADPHLLSQVVLNIWKNSLEAGADRMLVTIAAGVQCVTVTIRDNGSGIAPDELQRVWLPYVTSKQSGTGLGLPVVKRMVETMAGSAAIRSATAGPQRGVTVILTFPSLPPASGGG